MTALLLLLSACVLCPPPGFECPDPIAVDDGRYPVLDASRADVVEGELEVVGDEVRLVYVDDLGHTWALTWAPE